MNIKQDYKIHPVPEYDDYGMEWPTGTAQLTIELSCFRIATFEKNPPGRIKSRFYHGLNIVRLLWPTFIEINKLYTNPKTGKEMVVWNNYFLETFEQLCTFADTALTGCASSGKTFTSSVYALICFYSSPTNTSILISTTSGTASERRIWADIKELHRKAEFQQNGCLPIGDVIEYLKALTFDPGKTLKEGANERDLRNGVIVVPIAKDSTGKSALDTIMGTKNPVVIWIIDELPAMMDNVLSVRSNLIFNPRQQVVGIGNANTPTDPHGLMCEPENGWDSIDYRYDYKWKAKTCEVLFLHGERSPNYVDGVFQSTEDATDYPFRYLSNRFYNNKTAFVEGNGDIERGKRTIGYMRFAIGFWYGDDVSNTVLSPEFVKENKADLDPLPWGYLPTRKFASLDPAFSLGGDNSVLSIAEIGEDMMGDQQLILKYCKAVNPDIGAGADRVAFRTALAKSVVEKLVEERVDPEDFAIDGSGDGGLVAQAIILEWSRVVGERAIKINILSSMEKSSNQARYSNRVTEYWYQVPLAIASGIWRGFNNQSEYAQDFFRRKIESVGKGVIEVMQKKKMKKEIKRSPDFGDSVSYLVYLINKSGLVRFRTSKQSIVRSRTLKEDSAQLRSRVQSTDYLDNFVGDAYLQML